MIAIPPNMCQKLIENYLKRINACNISREDYLNDDKKEISWKKIFYMCFIYVYFWNHEIDNPI